MRTTHHSHFIAVMNEWLPVLNKVRAGHGLAPPYHVLDVLIVPAAAACHKCSIRLACQIPGGDCRHFTVKVTLAKVTLALQFERIVTVPFIALASRSCADDAAWFRGCWFVASVA
jgi:hypothetical protein